MKTLRRVFAESSSRFRQLSNSLLGTDPSTRFSCADISELVTLIYRHFLKRDPEPGQSDQFKTAVANGYTLAEFIRTVANSEEAQRVRSEETVLASLSDGQFVLWICEVLSQRGGVSPEQLEAFKSYLHEDLGRRSSLINQIASENFPRPAAQKGFSHSPHECRVMGTNQLLTLEQWKDRASQLAPIHDKHPANPMAPLEHRSFRHTGEFLVSAIASLYRGRNYIEQFLDNITSQSIFDRSELIIIDADSPENEQEAIEKYQAVYSNIVYKRINYRIGIYEAWNEGIRLARGSYLTNTNLDDLRRRDSFELQARALDQFPFVDVVYQDFYYSFDSDLTFDQVAEFGFKSDLPIVTPYNLLCFNSPHNAPMWRAQLHKELGGFDTSFQSAGDYEFWMRCMRNGKSFFKLNTPHVCYFQNPKGVSTSTETKGHEEARRIFKKYTRELMSPFLTMSKVELAKHLNIAPDWPSALSTYAIVQERLKSVRY